MAVKFNGHVGALTHVEITPQPATHDDTVRIEAIGREGSYKSCTNIVMYLADG